MLGTVGLVQYQIPTPGAAGSLGAGPLQRWGRNPGLPGRIIFVAAPHVHRNQSGARRSSDRTATPIHPPNPLRSRLSISAKPGAPCASRLTLPRTRSSGGDPPNDLRPEQPHLRSRVSAPDISPAWRPNPSRRSRWRRKRRARRARLSSRSRLPSIASRGTGEMVALSKVCAATASRETHAPPTRIRG